MIHTIILFLSILLVTRSQGQTISEKIAFSSCEYLKGINDINQLQDSINGSITASMAEILMGSTPEERNRMGDLEDMRGTMKEAYDLLPSYCYNVRRLIIKGKKSKFYNRSGNAQANKHFDNGNKLFESKNYKSAIKEFKAAVSLDKNFIYALDHLATSCREQEDYKSALKYYKKSLEIFPEGDVALLNISICYALMKDENNAIKNYEQLKFFYPELPEGYFGLAKIYFLKETYDKALDNLFTAHRIYVETNSEYIKDSELLMSHMFAKLKSLDKTELIYSKAEQHNVKIDK